MVSGEPGVTYYVKPSQSTKCPGQPCETLNYYLKNVNTTVNKEKNLTMIFLNGNHSLDAQILTVNPVIRTPVIKMIGESINATSIIESEKVVIVLEFYDNSIICLGNLTFVSFYLNACSKQLNSTFLASSLKIISMFTWMILDFQLVIENTKLVDGSILLSGGVLRRCKLENVDIDMSTKSKLELIDCTFFNSPLNVLTDVIVSETTIFSATENRPAISCYYEGSLTLSGNVTFANNSATRGGALALYSCTVNIAANTSVTFVNNSANYKGGAIYVEPGISPNMVFNSRYRVEDLPCFYRLLNCSDNAMYNFYFTSNSAVYGGDDVFGASFKYHSCSHCNLTMNISSPSNSSVSSDALRVCLCDEQGLPQCKNNSYLNVASEIYPDETFKISAVLIGGDFGLTTGTIYADIYPGDYSIVPSVELTSENSNIIKTAQCSEVEYSLRSQDTSFVTIFFTTVQLDVSPWHGYCSYDSCFRTAAVFMSFNILPCPVGFNLTENPPHCDCNELLFLDLKITCQIVNGEGYFSWTGNPWINISENNETAYTKHCPHNYCKTFNGTEKINLRDNSTYQCELNRRGRLCGECKEGYSLAIGSSRCIHCTNNNNLALFIFFAAAGFLLVIFVGLLNLTVSTGTINGLIFYANIIWTYKDIFFTSEGESSAVLIFLKSFIAWVNLDFGIETCFVKGLTAFWKTWLQFIFPFYIWAIAGLIILASRYSFRLTKLLGNRALPLLATLFLLSYMKLLRTVGSTLEFSVINIIPFENTTKLSSEVVWSVDGSLSYFSFPHIFLFVAGLFNLLFLWLPYTLLLFLMQWLRRLPHVGIIKWIMRFHPLYDSYFAPLKPKHHAVLVWSASTCSWYSASHICINFCRSSIC